MLKNVLIYMSLSTIFISSLRIETPAGVFFVGYILLGLSTLGLAHMNNWVILKKNVLIFIAILAGISTTESTAYIYLNNIKDSATHIMIMMAKVSLLSFFLASFYLVYRSCGKSAERTFSKYLTVATVFSILGIAQELVYITLGIDIHQYTGGTSKNYGAFIAVTGLSVEPAFYACALLPAAAYHISNFVNNLTLTPSGIATIIAIALSTSSLGYLGIFIAVTISYLSNLSPKKIGIILATAPLIILIGYNAANLDFFKMRLDDTISVLNGAELTMKDGMNLSTYSNAVNTSIALNSAFDNYGIGPGFGMYPTVYDKNIANYEDPGYREIPGRGSATSLFARLTAEMGLFGWWVIAFIAYCALRSIRGGYLTSINIAYLSTLIIILIRMGEYYINGVILVFLMIYLINLEMRARDRLVSTARL